MYDFAYKAKNIVNFVVKKTTFEPQRYFHVAHKKLCHQLAFSSSIRPVSSRLAIIVVTN